MLFFELFERFVGKEVEIEFNLLLRGLLYEFNEIVLLFVLFNKR